MTFATYSNDSLTVIEVESARFDAKLVTQFRDFVDNLPETGNKPILLDLTHVNFMDSSALGVVMAFKKHHQHSDISIVTESAPVLQLFKITKVDQIVKVYSDLEQAIMAG
ncbi:STAS domain-containing protein [Vibrio sp. 10N]|uniref:STAS domain-containing protein n=1 Tax=Vibrio sp. 10N TaxID=3058938 RepID=UPI002812B3B5|nr:STAS domain-containing protein [Vibrio sp. 10N]